MKNTQEVFCKNMKRLRVIKGLSQGELAHKIGMDQTQISRIENGKVEPGIGTVGKIAKGLGVLVNELFYSINSNPTFQKLEQLGSLSETDQQLVNALLDSLLDKAQFFQMRNNKMWKRLEELEQARHN